MSKTSFKAVDIGVVWCGVEKPLIVTLLVTNLSHLLAQYKIIVKMGSNLDFNFSRFKASY